jgi:hypothetical protein
MKNMEVLHTLRLYDADFIAKLGTLLEREKTRYRNKNEFMTAIVKQGYASYIAAAKKADGDAASAGAANGGKDGAGVFGAAAPRKGAADADGDAKGVSLFLTEMNDYITLQFRIISIYHEVYQKMLSAIYRMQISSSGGDKVSQASVEAGFYDDLQSAREFLAMDFRILCRKFR